MRTISIACMVLASTLAQAHEKPTPPAPPATAPDSGLFITSNDKAEHAAVGALFGLAGRLQFRENRWHALAVPAAAGLAKELLDAMQRGNKFDPKDFAATLAGGLVGVALGDGLIYVTRSNGTTKVVLAKTFE